MMTSLNKLSMVTFLIWYQPKCNQPQQSTNTIKSKFLAFSVAKCSDLSEKMNWNVIGKRKMTYSFTAVTENAEVQCGNELHLSTGEEWVGKISCVNLRGNHLPSSTGISVADGLGF